MGLFDRFRKKPPRQPEGPAIDRDTMALALFRTAIHVEQVAEVVEKAFGPQSVVSVDRSHSTIPALTLKLEDLEFFCSCFPMPQPKQVCDLSAVQEGLFSDQEREEMLAHQCFLVLAQQGGGGTLADKRRICRLFTRLTGALMGLEAAVGVYVNGAELLISRRVYLHHAAILEENREDPEYFPVPLWVGIRSGRKGDIPLVGTWGLKRFGFLELWFLGSPSPELWEKLYLMSLFQITGKELYQNTDTIEFTPGNPSVFKELNGALFIVGPQGGSPL